MSRSQDDEPLGTLRMENQKGRTIPELILPAVAKGQRESQIQAIQWTFHSEALRGKRPSKYVSWQNTYASYNRNSKPVNKNRPQAKQGMPNRFFFYQYATKKPKHAPSRLTVTRLLSCQLKAHQSAVESGLNWHGTARKQRMGFDTSKYGSRDFLYSEMLYIGTA